ncbi:hypothetical protein BX666DRAFT_1933981, partial [Dichotomocladium elegans]
MLSTVMHCLGKNSKNILLHLGMSIVSMNSKNGRSQSNSVWRTMNLLKVVALLLTTIRSDLFFCNKQGLP